MGLLEDIRRNAAARAKLKGTEPSASDSGFLNDA